MSLSILDSAMAAFVKHKGDRSFMDVPAWAKTFDVTGEDVRKAWERHMSIASQQPQNAYEVEGK